MDEPLDAATISLVRFAAAVAGGSEPEIRERAAALEAEGVPPLWTEELLLQSVLMVGYPRALIAFDLWRGLAQEPAPAADTEEGAGAEAWRRRGEATCAAVYGENYERLRTNVRSLHPALDRWMVEEGYGRTLGRPGLDLLRRELCTVAQTAVLDTPRQLHSHLRGALNVGASVAQVDAALTAISPALPREQAKRVREVWRTVRERWAKKD